MHLLVPFTLRASNCPQSWPPRSCSVPSDLSWARCGAWAELSGAYDVAVPKRVESGGETAKDLHANENFWMGVNPVSSLWGARITAAQIKNMVNSLLWFIKIITHGLSLRAFSHEFLIASFSSSLKSCGLKNRIETMATSEPSWLRTQVDINPNCLLLSYLYDLRNYSTWNISGEPQWLGTRNKSTEIIFAKFILYI